MGKQYEGRAVISNLRLTIILYFVLNKHSTVFTYEIKKAHSLEIYPPHLLIFNLSTALFPGLWLTEILSIEYLPVECRRKDIDLSKKVLISKNTLWCSWYILSFEPSVEKNVIW